MALAGDKFVVDLSDDDEGHDEQPQSSTIGSNATPNYFLDDFVGDIVEREVKAPSMPVLKSTTTGFPEHKKRSRFSTFKSERAAMSKTIDKVPSSVTNKALESDALKAPTKNVSFEDSERARIDKENKQRLGDMSEEEIRQERAELMSTLSPELIEMMLNRANLDDGRGDTWIKGAAEEPGVQMKQAPVTASKPIAPSVESTPDNGYTEIPQPIGTPHTAAKTVTLVDDDAPPSDPGHLQSPSQFSKEVIEDATPGSMHFPTAPQAPDLDPDDPAFLSSLHEKYFPTLPADPSKLAWMAPIPTAGSVADQDSPYYPGATSLNASALRFNFRGDLLPPRIARAIPTTKGLHHHGEAPESAGYTIPELSRLCRSAYPAQRCIAFATIGRLLYKLGQAQFGDDKSEVALGLWKCVEDGKVVESLEEAATADGGHQGSKVYAIEALWLYQKGGGTIWKRKKSMAGV